MLEDFHKQIGTDNDSKKFRQRVEASLKDASEVMKNCGKQIQEFKNMKVPDENSKNKDDQVTAFSESNNTLMKKLKDIGVKI